jgi:hypothetical protein
MKQLLISIPFFLLFSCSPIETEDDLFVSFWETMDKNYVFFEEKGVNWDSVYNVYYPQTRNISKGEYLAVFQDIIDLFQERIKMQQHEPEEELA